jgi:hypothetical protein
MKKIYFITILSLSFIGCFNNDKDYYDQDKREELFFECLKNIPKGPDDVKYNDWSEVVKECGDQSREISYVSKKFIRNDNKNL